MTFESGRALVIGVGSYMHMPWVDIPISVDDARAVKKRLIDTETCGYLPEQVKLMHDGSARKADILQALDELKESKPGDTVIVFYCGHGEYGTDGNYYLTSHDTKLDGGKIKAGSGVSETELFDKLRQIPAKRLLLLFNACHSGELSSDLGLQPGRSFGDVSLPDKSRVALLSTGEGRIIITASRPQQRSWIGLDKISIFTKALVHGLGGAGYVSNNNGTISAFGLYEHIYFEVREAAEALGKEQEPELTVLRGVGPFPVALYKGASEVGAFDFAEALPEDTVVHEVSAKKSERLAKNVIKQIEAGGEKSVAAETIRDSIVSTGDDTVIQKGKYNIKIDKASGMAIGDGATVLTHHDSDEE
ncbi:MAG: caspase family protein [Chloroflexi bacterium]|nr:caspase family protein [Chloroflexota bacterium]